MIKYTARRLLVSIPVLFAASFLCFGLTTAMGDPLAEWKLTKPRTAAEIAYAEQRAGLHKPFLVRYKDWAIGFVRGDWGTTVTPGNGSKDVRGDVMRASGVSIRLLIVAEIIALIIGVLLGVIGAVRQYSMFDYVATGVAFTMFSMPLFCVAVMIKYVTIDFNDFLQSIGIGRWLRTAGPPNGGFHGSFGDQLYQYTGAYLLPTICLVLLQFAFYSRFQRASMLEALNSDFVRTAQAKGLSQARVLMRHALRTALIPVTTLSALSFGGVIAGGLITETVFGWQGMGELLIEAVNLREPYLLLGFLMVTAVATIVFNLIADVMYAVLDPRIRL